MRDTDRDVPDHLAHFTLTSGFDLFNPDVTIELTEQSKEFYVNAAPGAGFIFILELPDRNIGDDPSSVTLHLVPAFYKDDGLIHGVNQKGDTYPFSLDIIIAPIGSLNSGIQHDQVASLLGLGSKRDNGLLMGGSVFKAGSAVRFLATLPDREGRIPNDYLLTRDHVNQRWSLHFVNRVPLSNHGGCVLSEIDTSTIQGLDEALEHLPEKEIITDYTFAERHEITNILTQLPIPKTELTVHINSSAIEPNLLNESRSDTIHLNTDYEHHQCSITYHSTLEQADFQINPVELPEQIQKVIKQLILEPSGAVSSEVNESLTRMFNELINEPLNREGQVYGFKSYNNRSSSLNVLSIKYTDHYYAFFNSSTKGHNAHLLQLPNEIPLKIFEKIVNGLCLGLNFPPESELGSNPRVPCGFIGPRAHLCIEQIWLYSSLTPITQSLSDEPFHSALQTEVLSELRHPDPEGAHSDNSSIKDPYLELLSIVNSGFFIEPGIRFKEQFYPNLKALVKALENKDELIDLQYIALKGIEKNNEVKEQHPKRDHTQNNYRLILFESICNAQSLEEAVDDIKSKFPQLCQRLVDTNKNTSS
ncbi:hypothetical protein [Legionella bononiensis]|uniref:Uncharacterized protein n=1 Tax=Legionella bononiensis TaxID=2793102 RepID=A0ABS1W756_9GAMM|nr:hypothetical protein [Legionella bononiensis]MBL7481293.1 hypothetical protein [Legionella bononiensis]MBL7525197.1 hypothetical protein [Legionella bononiensis]MBL7561380.1 hypothetical protein [Legionella bononiensis]